MKWWTYVQDQALFLTIQTILYVIGGLLCWLAQLPIIVIVLIGLIWFVPVWTYFVFDYWRWQRYVSQLNRTLAQLDHGYLLPVVMKRPHFASGQAIDDILRMLSRDMHEHVKTYAQAQAEYQTYIELWVHEIKTPIASSKLVIENNRNEVTHKLAPQLERIETYVEQVLYYAKSLEAEKDYTIRKMALAPVIKAVVKRNRRDFIEKQIRLELLEIECDVYSDPKWLEFILNQLVINAIQYATNESPCIRFQVEHGVNALTLTIHDNGVGIPEQDLPRVFEKWFTGENGRTFGKSTGMGLYLCKQLSEKLGLGCHITSKLGEGTTLALIFPIAHQYELHEIMP